MTATTRARPAAVTHQHDTSRIRITRSSVRTSRPARGYTGNLTTGTETFSCLHAFSTGAIERKVIAPMPINEMVLTVAVMTVAFVGEVAVFALLGIF
jgi:hypothetical protein